MKDKKLIKITTYSLNICEECEEYDEYKRDSTDTFGESVKVVSCTHYHTCARAFELGSGETS